jgi:hypothetical protein
MQKWEYAWLEWAGEAKGAHRAVTFSHRDPWDKLGGTLPDLVRRLGDDGWELVLNSYAMPKSPIGLHGLIAWTLKRPLA